MLDCCERPAYPEDRAAKNLGLTAFGGPIAHLGYFEREIIERRKWLTQNAYGDLVALCQFLPGPASSQVAFALGYLREKAGSGETMPAERDLHGGWFAGLWCLVWIFLPSFLLLLGTLPYWSSLRQNAGAQAALRGANATVVGILLAALYNPVWTVAVDSSVALIIALAAFGLLQFWKWSPWLLVLLSGGAGFVFLRQ